MIPGDVLVVRNRGFTLVETLVVVAIIVIMAMMLLPVYETAIKHAEGGVCLMNLRALACAAGVYAEDYDGFCVPACIGWPPGLAGTSWEALLQPYLRTTQILLCASDPLPNTTSWMYSYKHSYGINYEIAHVGGYSGASLSLWDLEDPAGTILFFDLRGSLRAMGGTPRGHGVQFVDARHGGRANFVFAAGNAKKYKPETTLQSRNLMDPQTMWEP
jgi:prepilin-type N-terminal cleavage/methylation domain-containing protein